MRDGATGRSRGFGFLTFKNPKTVSTVMVKEHFLDGKIVRPTLFAESRKDQLKLGLSETAKAATASILLSTAIPLSALFSPEWMLTVCTDRSQACYSQG